PPNGIPDKALLDAVVPDRPIHLSNREGHGAWVNSRALQIAKITKQTSDPPNGRIDRDPKTGEPIGSLQEEASQLVSKFIPPMRKEWIEKGMQFTSRYLNSFGITAWQDASVSYNPNDTYQMFDTYRRALEQDKLNAHVVLALRWNKERGLEQIEEIKAAAKRVSSPDLNAYTVKIRLDGIIDTHTAALVDDYSDRPGFKGETQVRPDVLKQAVAQLDAAGFQVHVHAIGDGTVREALDAFEYARQRNGDKLDNRHHIAHLQLVHPDDLPRFKQLNVNANFQPRWFYASNAVDMTAPRIGPERMQRVYAIQNVMKAGARVLFGSDWMVTSVNPLEAIKVAVTRIAPFAESGEPFLPEQRITLEQAIAGYTIDAAYVNHLDDRTGSLEVGKLADLGVLDRNLFQIEPAEISNTRVLLTLFGGRPVHGDWQAVQAERTSRLETP
ncbi:amidohydrolase, partial [Steroidobacter sp.]|uniref:amidohydrolase n=1 Tax=Steroidobacter sp. TaxID=1978227 RepID=UPI001A58C9B1